MKKRTSEREVRALKNRVSELESYIRSRVKPGMVFDPGTPLSVLDASDFPKLYTACQVARMLGNPVIVKAEWIDGKDCLTFKALDIPPVK